ncbi:MAG: hypothetical protein HDR27_03075 [Lachnospiraceae bacterium]|nr:hypothetical protein [Lachnospiraceae bacterium]
MKSERFYGMGEPLIQRESDTGVEASEYLELVKALGCTAYRSWMHLTDILKDSMTPNEEVLAAHKRLLDRAAELDLEVTGMSHEWFLPKGCKQGKGHAMPKRDLTKGSLYMQALEMLEESWCTQAKLFPQVGNWEIGNEWNLNAFLHPDGFLEDKTIEPFTADEKMDIAIDMMYFAAKGVRRGNPNAKVTCFSPALSTPWLGGDLPDYLPPMYGIAWTLDRMYRRIKSGEFWSDNTDDYFDMLSWHPYQMSVDQSKVGMDLFLDIFEPDHLWKDYNDAAYRVMCKYGDGHKQVILTEVGFTDCGNEEEEIKRAEYTCKILKMAAELPYVRTIYNFRLLNEEGMLKKAGIEDNQIGGLAEVYFGFFEEPWHECRPRKKAYVLQKMTGSKADLAAVGKKVAATRKEQRRMEEKRND